MFSLLAMAPVSAATHKTGASGKSASSSSKKSASTKGKTGKKSRTAKRSAPRQSEPTPDRYMQIQQALADKGFFTGSVNGVWGPDSVAALKQFQESQNLAVDGKLVRSGSFVSNQIDISTLAGGVYFIRLLPGCNNQFRTLKVIKQ